MIRGMRNYLVAAGAALLAACSSGPLVDEQQDVESDTLLIAALAEHGLDGLQDAADDGEAEATRLLGYCYAKGFDACGYDSTRAEQLFGQAIAAGSNRARGDLCHLRMLGLPPPEQAAAALGLCIEAAEAGDPEARMRLIQYAFQGQQAAVDYVDDPVAMVLADANAGDVFALELLAYAYMQDWITPPSPQAGLEAAQAAVARGSDRAQLVLAYQRTLDASSEDALAAIADFRETPLMATPRARSWAGLMLYQAGETEDGLALVEEAASTGLPEAQSTLAYLLMQSSLADARSPRVTELITAAGEGNDVFALETLTEWALEDEDLEGALGFIERAARTGKPANVARRDEIAAALQARAQREALVQAIVESMQQERSSPAESRPQQVAATPVRTVRRPNPPSNSCTTTGAGPGNLAACGPDANYCTTTGAGRGNSAACGGLANYCTTTGAGAGNDAACGGLANYCTTTGAGAGNAAACGGRANHCTTTGAGAGNDAACGGEANYCTDTGAGSGNVRACGGRSPYR